MSKRSEDGLRPMAESPSLASPFTQEAPAYELKFLLRGAQTADVIAWARQHLTPDPHAHPATGSYLIHSLYFDTDGLHIYHRRGSYQRCKYRIRRYGDETLVYLERKLKIGDRVRKRRIAISQAELACLAQGKTMEDWPGRWFQRRLWTRSLKPICQVSYQRVAYAGLNGEGPLRLTLDSQVICAPQPALSLDELPEALPLLPDQPVLELKFRGWMPALFKQLVTEFGLRTAAVSKYRLGIQAFGLDAPRPTLELPDA
jgi:hypothetical protein